MIDSTTYTISQYVDFSPESILALHLNSTELTDNIFGHGCYCSILSYWNAKSIRGGYQPVDDLDEVCRKWFRCRQCNDKHLGGSCNDEGVLKDDALTYELVQNRFDDGTVIYECNTNLDGCARDSCIIDVEYITELTDYIDTFLDRDTFTPHVINATSCPHLNQPAKPKFCNGTVPDLYTTDQPQLKSATDLFNDIEAMYPGLVKNVYTDDAASSGNLVSEGKACKSGSNEGNACNCDGEGNPNTIYVTFDPAIDFGFGYTTSPSPAQWRSYTWEEAKLACEHLGLKMATDRSQAENDILKQERFFFTGGRRDGPYNWVYDDDMSNMFYPGWHGTWRGGSPRDPTHRCAGHYDNGYWNAIDCVDSKSLLCEYRVCDPRITYD